MLQHSVVPIKPNRLREVGIVVEKSAELYHGTMLAGHFHGSNTQAAPAFQGDSQNVEVALR